MVAPESVAPSPNCHEYWVIDPSGSNDAVPLKLTFCPVTGEVGEKVKEAVGGWFGEA